MTAITEQLSDTRRQTLAMVWAAELRRSLAAGGLRIALIVSVALGGVVGGLFVWGVAANSPDTGIDPVVNVLPFGGGVGVAALAFTVGLIGFVSREMADGTATGSAVLVPRRARLLWARALSATTIGAAMTVATLALVSLARLLAGGVDGTAVGHWASVGAVAVLDVVLASTLAFLVATLLRKPAIAVAIFLLALVVLPLILLIVSFAAPSWLAEPAGAIFKTMPGTLFERALNVPVGDGGNWSEVRTGLIGLAVWVVAVAPLTGYLFGKALANKE